MGYILAPTLPWLLWPMEEAQSPSLEVVTLTWLEDCSEVSHEANVSISVLGTPNATPSLMVC